MKYIAREDLQLILDHIDANALDALTLGYILDTYGDDYFIEDGKLVSTTKNTKMAEARKVCKAIDPLKKCFSNQ